MFSLTSQRTPRPSNYLGAVLYIMVDKQIIQEMMVANFLQGLPRLLLNSRHPGHIEVSHQGCDNFNSTIKFSSIKLGVARCLSICSGCYRISAIH